MYDHIYAMKDNIPGYDRYYAYSIRVLTERDPLRYLADHEDMYWAVLKYIERRRLPSDAKILEVGSGLGYLTYALTRRNLAATGLDISAQAVEIARSRYGEHFVVDDLHGYSARHASMYDVVIMTEVIEHVEQPMGFVADAIRLLKPGGDIVLTTPNKSMYEPSEHWLTESPPVHLWWFSETSMAFIANALRLELTLLDFKEYNDRYAPLQTIKRLVPSGPVLDELGNVCFREPSLNSILRRLRLLHASQRIAYRAVAAVRTILGRCQPASGRRGQLCAVFRACEHRSS